MVIHKRSDGVYRNIPNMLKTRFSVGDTVYTIEYDGDSSSSVCEWEVFQCEVTIIDRATNMLGDSAKGSSLNYYVGYLLKDKLRDSESTRIFKDDELFRDRVIAERARDILMHELQERRFETRKNHGRQLRKYIGLDMQAERNAETLHKIRRSVINEADKNRVDWEDAIDPLTKMSKQLYEE